MFKLHKLHPRSFRCLFKLCHQKRIQVLTATVSHLHRSGRSISFIYPLSIGLLRGSKHSLLGAGNMMANKTEKAPILIKFTIRLERENINQQINEQYCWVSDNESDQNQSSLGKSWGGGTSTGRAVLREGNSREAILQKQYLSKDLKDPKEPTM